MFYVCLDDHGEVCSERSRAAADIYFDLYVAMAKNPTSVFAGQAVTLFDGIVVIRREEPSCAAETYAGSGPRLS